MHVGERIYQLRTEKEMSQGDLADALEVSRQSISKWENGVSVPELEKLVKLSEVFGVTLDTLVTGKEGEPQPTPEPQVVYIEKTLERKCAGAQKWCIVLCSLVCVLLVANLLAIFLKPGSKPETQPSSGPTQQEATDFQIPASEVSEIEIVWNGGNVCLTAEDTDKITISGVNEREHYSAEHEGSLLRVQQRSDIKNDLVITVPKDWISEKLKLRGTDVAISFMYISVGSLELDGSDCVINMVANVENIQITGNRNILDLTLPMLCGFALEMDFVRNTFRSDLIGIQYEQGRYSLGNQRCEIQVDGVSNEVYIAQSTKVVL